MVEIEKKSCPEYNSVELMAAVGLEIMEAAAKSDFKIKIGIHSGKTKVLI